MHAHTNTENWCRCTHITPSPLLHECSVTFRDFLRVLLKSEKSKYLDSKRPDPQTLADMNVLHSFSTDIM